MAMPKWDKSEQEMEDAGVTQVTRSCPPRCRTWFYAHGGALDPKTGLVSKKASLNGAKQKLLEAIEDARKGVFMPNRRMTSLRAPWKILNTREEHEARALFPGMRAFRTGMMTTGPVQERRWRRRRRGSWRRSRGSRTQNAFKA